MHGAALHQRLGPHQPERLLQPRRAVDDDEIRRPKAAGDEVIKQTPPGRLALTAHVAHCQQHLLAIAPNAQHHQQ
jgi:hypothetical protein